MSRSLNLNDFNKEKYEPILASSGVYRDIHTKLIHPVTGDLMVSTDIDAITNSVKNIICTPSGTRPFNPEFGTRLTRLLFEPMSPITERQIRLEIEDGISKFEPRISKVQVNCQANYDFQTYNISLFFQTQYAQSGEIKFILNKIR